MRPAFLCEANGLRRPVQAVQVPKVQQQLRVPCKQPLTSSTASVLHAERLSSCAQATCSQRFDRLAMHATAAEVKRPPTDAPPSGKASSPFMQVSIRLAWNHLVYFNERSISAWLIDGQAPCVIPLQSAVEVVEAE